MIYTTHYYDQNYSFCSHSVTLTSTSALAELVKVGTDVYVADDTNGNIHRIEYVRMDHEGDVQLKVSSGNVTEWFWVNCPTDSISLAQEGATWTYVDHRKMEGYYSDVACRK